MKLTCALKPLSKRFIKLVLTRFLISGLLNTGITYFLYLGFLQIYSYRIAYTGAFLSGILTSYGLNAMFVFRSGVALRTLIRFPVVYLVHYVLGLVLVTTLVDFVGIAAWIAPIFSILVSVPLTYILSRMIFLSKKETKVDSGP